LDLRRKVRDKRQQVLLALARRGNEDAFRRLYGELYLPVSSYVRRRVAVAEDAEDIIAGVFHRFLQRLDSFDGQKGSVMTWVVTMARNAVIDHLRRERPAAASVEDLADQLAGAHPDPLQTLVASEELRQVQRLVARQPAEIREMFALRFEQGLRVREVAQIVGLSEEAAKQRFARTLRKIQLQLRDEERDIGKGKGESPCAATD
jgi:RNA polymerase sigma-70 factor (ECF subfamily)